MMNDDIVARSERVDEAIEHLHSCLIDLYFEALRGIKEYKRQAHSVSHDNQHPMYSRVASTTNLIIQRMLLCAHDRVWSPTKIWRSEADRNVRKTKNFDFLKLTDFVRGVR